MDNNKLMELIESSNNGNTNLVLKELKDNKVDLEDFSLELIEDIFNNDNHKKDSVKIFIKQLLRLID